MRSFTPKTIFIASLLATLPLGAAYASSGGGDYPDPATLQGSRLSAVLNQAEGVRDAITDAHRGREIGASEARMLESRTGGVIRTAERVAAENHGRMPATSYKQVLRRLDNIDQRLLVDTGSGFSIGDGGDTGHYPSG